jgi:hypothetical protein
LSPRFFLKPEAKAHMTDQKVATDFQTGALSNPSALARALFYG